MRSVLIFLFLSSGFSTLHAQDIIVRVTGDTMRVKIDKANDDFIYYQSTQTRRGQVDVISRMEVSSILYNFEAATPGLEKVRKQSIRKFDQFEGWFLYGAYFLPINFEGSSEFRDYYKKLQFGWGFRGGGQFFVNKSIGFGVTYSQSRYNNSVDIRSISSGQTGKLQNDILLRYTGASFVYRKELQHVKSTVELFAGFGYTWFTDDAKQIESYFLSGEGFTGNVSAALNVSIGEGIFIPIKLAVDGINVSNLRVDVEDETSDFGQLIKEVVDNTEKENITRISATIGLLFSF